MTPIPADDAFAPANLKDGDRRTVTVVFADLAGFSRLSERLDPEEVDAVMNGLFSRFEAIVRQHEGSVEKYIGDAMVAVFGWPLIHEDDAVRAVNAALDFQDAVEALAGRQNGLVPNGKLASADLRFRIGIHTGLITTGRRGEFEVVTGHTMSVAARVQGEAPVGGILVTRTSLDECGSEFLCSEAITFTGKNLSEPVEACRVTGRNRQYLLPERHFVGRQPILDAMVRAYTRHQGGSAGGLALAGAPGNGKTAVVRAFLEQVRRLPDFRSPILWARARRFRNRPFAVITDLILNHADVDPRKGVEGVQESLAALPGLGPGPAAEFARFLVRRDQLGADDSQAFSMLAAIIRAISERSRGSVWPTIIFVDNTDLADRQSLDFLSWFVHGASPQPFMLFTQRDAPVDLLPRFPGLNAIEVPPLSSEESRQLLRALLPDHPLEADSERLVLDNAAGVPLFIQAYARYLRANPQEPGGVPQTVQNLFLTTIARFNEDIADLLKKLSVFRYNFTLEDARFIQERTDGDPAIVEPALGFFEREDILWQEKGSYFFRHDLFKNALYDSLLNYNKKILHGLVVELMLRQHAPHPVRLVWHLTRSGQYAAAITTIKSSPEALTNLEFAPLIDTLMEAIDPTDRDTRRGLSLTKAGLLFNNGMNSSADALLKELLLQAFSENDLRCAAGSYHLLAHYNRQSYRFQKAEFCGRKALACYERISASQGEQADVLATLCLNSTLEGRQDDAQAWLDRLCRQGEGLPGPEAVCLDTRIERALLLGEWRAARRLVETMPPERRAESPLAWQVEWAQLRLADLDPLLSGWLERCQPQGVEAVQALCALAIARGQSKPERPWYDLMERAEFLGLRAQNDFDRVLACRAIGEAWFQLGEELKAETVLLEGLSLGERHSTFRPSFSMLVLLVELYARRASTGRALFFLDEARHIAGLGPLVERRDLLLYNRALKEYGALEAGADAALLAKELDELDSPDARSLLAALPSLATLAS